MQKQHDPIIRVAFSEVIEQPSPACREVAFHLVTKEFKSREDALVWLHELDHIPMIKTES